MTTTTKTRSVVYKVRAGKQQAAVAPVKCTISKTHLECECCGKADLMRSVELSSHAFSTIFLGVICTQQWFDQPMRGNPYDCAARLQRKINLMDVQEVADIVDAIREAGGE